MTIENYATLHPDVIGVEILRFADEDGNFLFASQLAMFMDDKFDNILYLPTDILSNSMEETAERTISGFGRLFSTIMGKVFVFDMDAENTPIIAELDAEEIMEEIQHNERSLKEPPRPAGATLH